MNTAHQSSTRLVRFVLPLILILIFVATILPATAPPSRTEVPLLFRQEAFTCATLADAVNYYVSIGEDASIKELSALDPFGGSIGGFKYHYGNVEQRIAWVCQILFHPKGNEPIGNPYTGSYTGGESLDSYDSMVPKDLPLVPLVASGSSYFVMSDNWLIMGCPEPMLDYLDYCRKNGWFRQAPVRVPTQAQAFHDLKMLRKTRDWRAIRWQTFAAYYESSEAECWEFMKPQALSIPSH